jgi:flagellar protein FlbD
MIELTRINGVGFSLNPELIEIIETTPDTVITLTTGRKFIVKESRQEVKNLVLSYKKDIYANLLKID